EDSEMLALRMGRRGKRVIVDRSCFESAVEFGIIWKGHAEEVSHQGQFPNRLLHARDALGADGAVAEFEIFYICLKHVAGKLLQLLLELPRRCHDSSCHHNGVATAARTKPIEAGVGIRVADHDV